MTWPASLLGTVSCVTIHLDSPDAEVKTDKRNGASQKLREKSMEEDDKRIKEIMKGKFGNL